MKPFKKLVIINEFLENKVGHYYEYDKSVMQTFQQQGIECVLYAKDTVSDEIKEELNAVPYFSYNPKLKIRKLKIIGPLLYRFYNWNSLLQQVKKIIEIETKNNESVSFFIPNIFWYNVLPILSAFSRSHTSVGFLYRTSILEPIEISKSFEPFILRLYNHAFKKISQNKEARFFTDSEVIAAEFQNQYHAPMSVLPIPHVFDSQMTLTKTDPSLFRLYLPGGARIEKGTEVITQALEYLGQYHPNEMKHIVVVMQLFGDKEKEELEALKKRIELLSCQSLFLGKLNSDEYQYEFNAADIILIPYLNDRGYRARTSGVLAEAIACSKPFITTQGSWMDIQSKQYKTGASIEDSNSKDLASALLDMMTHYEAYKQKAIEAKQAWMHFHSKSTFYKVYMNPET
jgi:glycosyltransferase involved in cell wall biosynthesis